MKTPLDPRSGLTRFFTADHRRCDALWAVVEEDADRGDAVATRSALTAFDASIRLHLDLEESILFPAFEEATGMRGFGPTAVMRAEHSQMRDVLSRMAAAAAQGDVDGVVDHGDTLMMLIQQHNLKEEGMLYPMAERALSPGWPTLAETLAAAYAPAG